MKFSELNLSGPLQAAIDNAGFSDCTPIQEQALPALIEGKDVAGLAQTGTGKTAAFLIPLMERVLRSQPLHGDLPADVRELAEKRGFKDWRAQNFILILVPTRELAEQVQEQTLKFGEVSGLRGTAIYGGTSYDKQKDALKRGVQFIAATPGRLIDLYKEHLVDLKQVRAIVFDEADRMFDMGFKDDMKYILQRVPGDRQFCVFSATLNFDVLNTAYQFGANPVEFNVSRDQAKAENVKDQIFHVGQEEKGSYLVSLLKLHNPKQAIIFTNFKHNVDRISRFLNDNGMPAMGISSLLTQAQRTKVMEMFKAENDKNILVATDVAARGLDIQGVDLVVNYELPMDAESYVHRIGRTGRAGQTGTAYSLVSDRDVDSLMRIEDYLKHKLETGFLDDKDIVKDVSSFPNGDSSPGRMLNDSFREGGGGGRGGRGGERGGRGGGRGGDRGRGPRRDGDRGPRRDGDRGPRRDGDRDRGPRAHAGERAEHIGAESQNGAHAHGQAGGEHRPRREGDRNRNRGPRREGERGERREGQQHRGGHGGGRRHEGQQGQRQGQGRSGGGPKGFKPPPKKQNAGLGGKVKGFFKKLFGQ